MANKDGTGWGELTGESTRTLLHFLKAKDVGKEVLQRARIASSVLSTVVRHEATESARVKTMINLARQLAEDKEQLRQYIRISMPDIKMLKEGKD